MRGWFGGYRAGWGRGGYGWRRGAYPWPGNPYPYCRNFPWLPRGWWAYGYGAAYPRAGSPIYGRAPYEYRFRPYWTAQYQW